MRRVPALVLLVVSLVASLLLAPAAQASRDTLYSRVDSARADARLAPLTRDAALQKVAQAWADSLARTGVLAHNPDYASQIPTGWTAAGENVAYAGSGHSAPDDVIHRMWMDSSGHRANILGAYTRVGIGRTVDNAGRVWAVQVFAAYPGMGTPVRLYSDVRAGEPFYESIAWLTAQGITGGYPDGSYGRTDPVTRRQMAAFLYRAAGSPRFTPPARATFADVPKDAPFHLQVEWLVATGLAARADRFRPGASVSRGEMAAFIARAKGPRPLSSPARASYVDVPPGALFYAPIEWMAREGVAAKAATNPRYNPRQVVTREQMAAFLHRAYR